MEYEYLFTKNLHESLKGKIKGKIFCKVIDDILIIDISTKEDIDYGCTIQDFAEKMRTGEITHEIIVEQVVKEYKRKVLNTFFYYW